MIRYWSIALAGCLIGLAHVASAQVAPGMGCSQSPCPPSQGGTGVNNGMNTLTLNGNNSIGTLNGWKLTLGLRPDASQASQSGASGYSAGDTITLGGGSCTTAPQVQVISASPFTWVIYNPGVCAIVPSDPVTQSATSGSGTGASFTFSGFWGPIAANMPGGGFVASGSNGALFYPTDLARSGAGRFLGNSYFGFQAGGNGGNTGDGMGGGTGMTAGESQGFGWNTQTQVTSGANLSSFGVNTFGHETTGTNCDAYGTDAGKWEQGCSFVSMLGKGAGAYLQSPNAVVAVGPLSVQGTTYTLSVSGAVDNGSGKCRLATSNTASAATGDKVAVTGIVGATNCNTNGPIAITVIDSGHIDTTSSISGQTYTSGGSVMGFGTVSLASVAAVGQGTLSGNAFRSTGGLAVVGNNGLNACTTCTQIAAFGDGIGPALTSGSQDTLIQGGATLSTGSGTIVIGKGADVTSGSINGAVAIGSNGAGGGPGAKVAGQQGVAIGGGTAGAAGAYATNNSVALGPQMFTPSLTGAPNIGVGYKDGQSCTSAANDILIAPNNNADCGTASDSHAIVVGTQASLVTLGSNTMTFENVWEATGTGTPSTSATTIAGTSTLTGTVTFGAQMINSHLTTGTNADTVCLKADGTFLIQAAACTISSLRFKNVRSGYGGDYEALGVIRNLEPIVFTMKENATPNPDWNYDKAQIGLSAENVAAIEPRCAIYEQDGKTPKSYRQECLIAVLVSAVQEQQREIADLRRHRR